MKYLLLLLMIASLPFSESIKTVSVYLALGVMICQLYKKDIHLEMTPLHWGFIIFLVASLSCSIFAENPMKSLRGTRDVLLYSTAFFVASTISNEKYAKVILWVLYVSAAIAAILGIVHFLQAGGKMWIYNLRNPNYIAMYMVIVLSSIVSYILFSASETWSSRIVLGLLAIALLGAAILTVFRASFIGFILFVGALVFAGNKTRKYLPYAAALIVIFLIAAFLYQPMWNKLMYTKSFYARLALWDYAIDLFKGNPGTGVGLDHYSGLIPYGVPDAGKTYYDAHSLYLNVAAQMGLPGLIALVFIISGFIREFCRARELSWMGMVLKYGALGAFLVIFAGGIFDTTLHHEHAVVFVILTGLFLANKKPDGLNPTYDRSE